jgi:phage terminase small subunit
MARDGEKKTQKKLRRPTQKQTRFARELAKGKSMKQAALDAGYSENTANRACVDILPRVTEKFQDVIRRYVSAEKIAQRIAEGLDAEETKFATFEGNITDARNTVAWSERRAYAELASKLGGFYVEKIEHSGGIVLRNSVPRPERG